MENKKIKSIILALLFVVVLGVVANAGNVVVKNGELNVSGTFFVDRDLLYVDSVTDKVGIGTTNPTYDLDVAGSMGVDHYIYHNGDSDTRAYFFPDGFNVKTGGKYLLELYEGAQDYVKLGDGGDVDINLSDNVFVRGSDGKVGIGTTNPNTRLEVQSAATQLTLRHSAGNSVMFFVGSSGNLDINPSGDYVEISNTLKLDDGILWDTSEKTNDFTVTDYSEDIYFVNDNMVVGITATLPTAADNEGRKLTFVKTDNALVATVLDGEGAETINGVPTDNRMVAQYDTITVVSDGDEWFIISEKIAVP